MDYYKFYCVIAIALIIAGGVNAESMEATLWWKYDVRVPNENLYVVALDSYGQKAIIADAPASGKVYAIDSIGNMIWKYGAGTYFYDSHAADFDAQNAVAILGMHRNAYVVDVGGDDVMRRGFTMADARTVHAADINNDGYLEYLIGVFSGRKATMQIVDHQGNLIKEVGLGGRQVPYATIAVDINGDGQKEILTGTATFAVNSMAENYELILGKGSFQVLTNQGEVLWKTGDGVISVDVGDLDGDKIPEIVLGTVYQVIALNSNGEQLWTFNTGGTVYDLEVVDVNNDTVNDIVATGGKKVFLLDGEGNSEWSYTASTNVMAIDVADLDEDGNKEIIIGSNKVEVVNSEGKGLWASSSYNTMNNVVAADLNGDSYLELISGSKDGWIRVFDTSNYAKTRRALIYKNKAEGDYDTGNYDDAMYYADNALMLYEDIRDTDSAGAVTRLIQRIESRIEADEHYNKSIMFYMEKDKDNTTTYANNAISMYRDLGVSFDRIEELNSILQGYQNIADASDYYNTSVSRYNEGLYADSKDYAIRAYDAYTIIGNQEMLDLSVRMINRSSAHMEADDYFIEGEYALEDGNETAARGYFEAARDIYTELGDSEAIELVNEQISVIDGSFLRNSLRTYGWVVIAFVFLLGVILLVIVLVFVVFKAKGDELRLLLGLYKKDKPKPPSASGRFNSSGGSSISSGNNRF